MKIGRKFLAVALAAVLAIGTLQAMQVEAQQVQTEDAAEFDLQILADFLSEFTSLFSSGRFVSNDDGSSGFFHYVPYFWREELVDEPPLVFVERVMRSAVTPDSDEMAYGYIDILFDHQGNEITSAVFFDRRIVHNDDEWGEWTVVYDTVALAFRLIDLTGNGIPEVLVYFDPLGNIPFLSFMADGRATWTREGGAGNFVRLYSFVDGRFQKVFESVRGEIMAYYNAYRSEYMFYTKPDEAIRFLTDNEGRTVLARINHSWTAGEMYAGFFEFSLENGEAILEPIVVAYNRTSPEITSADWCVRVYRRDFTFDLYLRNYVTGEEMPVDVADIHWWNPYILTMPDRIIMEMLFLRDLQGEVSSLVEPNRGPWTEAGPARPDSVTDPWVSSPLPAHTCP